MSFPKVEMSISLYSIAFFLTRPATIVHGIKRHKNANFLNSHFLFLCASLYTSQPLKSQHFFSLNQSLVWGHWRTITWCYAAKSEHPAFHKQKYETDSTHLWHTLQKYFTRDFHFQSLMTLFPHKTMNLSTLASTAQSAQCAHTLQYRKYEPEN